MSNDTLGLFEDERDAAGQLVLSEVGERFKQITEEAMKRQVDNRMDELVETADAYMELVNENAEDSVAEIRKLMLLAVHTIAGPKAVKAFVDKIGELARSGALSSASGEWASGGPGDASSNRDSIHGGGISVRKEDVEPLAEGYVRAISRTARKG